MNQPGVYVCPSCSRPYTTHFGEVMKSRIPCRGKVSTLYQLIWENVDAKVRCICKSVCFRIHHRASQRSIAADSITLIKIFYFIGKLSYVMLRKLSTNHSKIIREYSVPWHWNQVKLGTHHRDIWHFYMDYLKKKVFPGWLKCYLVSLLV